MTKGLTLGRPDRRAWLIAALLVATVLVIGCGDDDGGAVEPPTALGEPEEEVKLVALPGYLEDGSTDPDVDWLNDFEQETGCEVSATTASSSDEIVELMQTGAYDAVAAPGDATGRLYEGGDVVAVDTELVPNYEDVFDSLKRQDHNTFDGRPYGVPQGRGANLLIYDPTEVEPAPSSWDVVFEAASEYSGKVTAYDSPIYIADAALYLRAHRPELGITDPYELDQDQFDAAIELLEEQRRHIGEYWTDYVRQIQTFSHGDSSVGTSWQLVLDVLNANGEPEQGILPDEGSTGWSDTWMIGSEAENPNCAYMWLDHIISPKANAAIAEWLGQAPANEKSCGLTANEDHCEIYHAADERYFDRIEYWKTPVSDCGDQRGDVCKTYDEWVQGWSEVTG